MDIGRAAIWHQRKFHDGVVSAVFWWLELPALQSRQLGSMVGYKTPHTSIGWCGRLDDLMNHPGGPGCCWASSPLQRMVVGSRHGILLAKSVAKRWQESWKLIGRSDGSY
jgi:hypothetical protein